MMKKIKLFLLVLLVLSISACVGWTRATGKYVDPQKKYSVDLPWGWMRYQGDTLILTRDGIWLENIVIMRQKFDKKLQYTKEKFVKGMLPEEICEVIVGNLKADKSMGNLEIIENMPVKISGIDGFKLVYTFTNEDGLKMKCIHYGFAHGDWVYEFSYTATLWNYFDKELAEFNKMAASFTLTETGIAGIDELVVKEK